jgi:hypothetical protein
MHTALRPRLTQNISIFSLALSCFHSQTRHSADSREEDRLFMFHCLVLSSFLRIFTIHAGSLH